MYSKVLMLLCFLISNSLAAQIFVKHDALGNQDGTSWEDAYVSLVDALAIAQPDAEIWVAGGLYKPSDDEGAPPDETWFEIDKKLFLYGGFAGTETALDQRDWEANLTILSADINEDDVAGDFNNFRADNCIHVVNVLQGVAGGGTIDGFIIQGGNAKTGDIPPNGNFLEYAGGGVLMSSPSTLKNCVIRENNGGFGSAFYTGFISNISVENCRIEENQSETGAFRLAGHQTALIKNCVFANNVAQIFGGAVTIGNTNATFENCTFSKNKVIEALGAGLFIFQNNFSSISAPKVDVIACNFLENEAPNGAGLGFNNFFIGSRLEIDSCHFEDNICDAGNTFGGAILLQSLPNQDGSGISLNTTIKNTNFVKNQAGSGGAILTFCNRGNFPIEISNCDFMGNLATDFAGGTGGAMVFQNSESGAPNVTLNEVTCTGNAADLSGGAILFLSSPSTQPLRYNINNSVFSKNAASESGGAIWGFNSTSITGNVIGTIRQSEFSGNSANGSCGAIHSVGEKLNIVDCTFNNNSTQASDLGNPGGGAIGVFGSADAAIERTVFNNNSSAVEGAGLYLEQSPVQLSNVLLTQNTGNNTIFNTDSLWMTNVTMVNNAQGLTQIGGSVSIFQNTILANNGVNYQETGGIASVLSRGGNISHDTSLVNYLTGFDVYADFNEVLPDLNVDFIPFWNSPCVDAGNPDGIEDPSIDLAGENRFQGIQIDIGAFESPFNTSIESPISASDQIRVFPNPFTTHLQIDSDATIKSIRLIDQAGKLVQQFSLATSLKIDPAIAPGIYFLEVVQGETVIRKKVVKM